LEVRQVGLVTISLRNGRRIAFEVDLGLEGPAYFVFGVRKSGSTLLNAVAAELARLNGRRFVNVGDKFFQQNVESIDWQYDPALPEILHPGNVYGGFRDMPFALLGNKLFERSPKLLIVRDPRDALVSEYFSNAYSHPIPEPTPESSHMTALMERQRRDALKNGPDVYVLDAAREMVRTIIEFGAVAKSSTTTVMKYEDYIFNKRELIGIIARQFGWAVDETSIVNILQWADVRPATEDPQAFIRKVAPGDHREKLRPATITSLDRMLRAAMRLLDYPSDPMITRVGLTGN
jgi:Sulfotransferase domain